MEDNVLEVGRNPVKPKLDIIFKKLFSNEELLKDLLSNALKIPEDSIKAIEFLNTEILPENIEGKLSRMDLKLSVDGRSVNVEIQIKKERDFADRALFLGAKLYVGGLESGEPFGKLKKSICINIVGFSMFTAPVYRSKFTMNEETRREVLSDKLEIHFFDLTKIPKIHDKINTDDKMELWLQFINAETEEEFKMLEQTGVAPIQQAVSSIYVMRNDRAIRQAAEEREIALHDEATRMEGARLDGMFEVARNGISMGMDTPSIITLTGLTHDEIEGLR